MVKNTYHIEVKVTGSLAVDVEADSLEDAYDEYNQRGLTFEDIPNIKFTDDKVVKITDGNGNRTSFG